MVGRVSILFFMPDVNFSEFSNLHSNPFRPLDYYSNHHQHPPSPPADTQHTPGHPKNPQAILSPSKPFSQSFSIKYTQITQKSLKSPKNALKSPHLSFSCTTGSEKSTKIPVFNPILPHKTPKQTTPKNFPDPICNFNS